MCFDKWAGWLIGLDNSKYQWAIAEHQLLKQEEERRIIRVMRSEESMREQLEAGTGPSTSTGEGGKQQQGAVEMSMSRH
ncbi:hypothetical protein TSOC_013851 [Tetrabaena socialis]|uniref:Uncharacterized protein n=1 Tax=Tetrabaena socialis TaxID=47790 RepID=A0A2J7ZJA1_9CHLO|nr:hypothetical protein TSOC_013851 [Tetrabaena socialis]|eukprot:PNH00330.1 hypothetical protein TSOC_013851 [Tetrabaena socialis]